MNEEDMKRLQRELKLSIYDLNKILTAIRHEKSHHFRRGDEEQTEYFQYLEDRLKNTITKE
jgi:hypothetical protein